MGLNKTYWQQRYLEGRTGWDLGAASPPLKAYIDQLGRTDLRILVPGAGRGFEAEYLYRKGFADFTVLDIAPFPLKQLADRLPWDFPAERLVEGDFFEYDGGPFDLILEHTFFCSLPPETRPRYAEKMAELLSPGGILAGLFFDFPLTPDGPPFGGSLEEYKTLFAPAFSIRVLERARNSIAPRAGRELFFIFEKK